MKDILLKNKHLLRRGIIALLLIALLFSFTLTTGFAVVEPSSQFYITDEAGVISSSTEQYIVDKNGELENMCGGQIVVVVVDFLDGMDIEDYAYKIFNDWEIGDAEKNNGILLLLTIGEENYWCMQGKGLENQLTAGDIDEILWYYLEDDFAAGDYDAGVRSVFDKLYTEVAAIYGYTGDNGGDSDYTDDYYDGPYGEPDNSFDLYMILIIAFIILFIVVLILSLGQKSRRKRVVVHHQTHHRPARPVVFGAPPRPRHHHSRPSTPSRPSRPNRPTGGGSSFGGGAGRRGGGSSFGGGMSRGGGGGSRGGGAGRRGR